MTVKRLHTNNLEAIEKVSLDELQALQFQRLQWTLNHAYKEVPHYKKKWDEHGVQPIDFKSLSNLSLFPFLEKKNLRDNYPYAMFAVPKDKIMRIHASSGTTGKPTIVGYTSKDIDHWANLVARSIRASGGRPGDIVQVAYGYGLFTGGLGAHYGVERAGCTVIPMSGGQTEKQIQFIQDLKPTIIMVTPSYMLTILDEMDKLGIPTDKTSLQIGIFGAEPWSESMRASMEKRANIDAIDIYGLSEIMGPGVACECIESKDGPVIWEDHFFPEIIDPITCDVLPDGENGELVITTLTREAMPIVRYRTRDLTRLMPPTSRNMRRIQKITGRSDDMLIIRGVNIFPSQIEEIICRVPSLSSQYLLEIDKDKHLDVMTVNVEMTPEAWNQGSESDSVLLGKKLESLIKGSTGISTQVAIKKPFFLERTQIGKAKRVIDKRPK